MSTLCRLLCCFPSRLKNDLASHSNDARPFESTPRPSEIHGEYNPNWPTCPLPRYTERPISIYEKTIIYNRGSNTQDIEGNEFPHDEKRQQAPNSQTEAAQVQPELPQENTGGDHASDASSTFSFPSSYGNTSTATRSPPPAYSAPSSRATSQRNPSISLTSVEADAVQTAMRTGNSPSPQPHLQHPRPVLHHGQRANRWIAHDTESRRSWESNRPAPPLPPTYSRD